MRLQLGSTKPGVASPTEAEILPVAVPIAFCSSTSYTSNVWVGSRYNCSHVASTCNQQGSKPVSDSASSFAHIGSDRLAARVGRVQHENGDVPSS